jgi:hypothetical protein
MRSLAAVAAAACVGVASPGVRLGAQGTAMPVVKAYPAATSYCSQHITGAPTASGPGPHITWTAYHSTDAPELVLAWYRERLPASSHSREGVEDRWRLPSEAPDTVVTVTAAADFKLAGSCETPLPAKARTVILISNMTRPPAR